jgi:hypothetical protein
MAGGGDSNEMNPFISYVDLFASIIMVLLLFILILFVNVGYYLQFNSKNKTEEKIPNFQEEKAQAPMISDASKNENHKETEKAKAVQFFIPKDTNNTTPVQGGEVEGNTLSKQSERFAKVDFNEQDMIISFKDNEYFLTKEVITQITVFMESILKKNPNALFAISVNDSKKIISSTQTKQVSLGRILSIKNALEKDPILQNKIKLNYQQAESLNYEFGYLKIDVK